MTTHASDDLLDTALNRLVQGQSVSDIAASHPAVADELRPLLDTAMSLQLLRQVELPPAESLDSDRNEFLAQVTELQLLPASPGPFMRLKGWLSQQPWRPSMAPLLQPREAWKMNALVLKFALVMIMILTSVGGTVAVAADSLPGSAAYPIKMAVEQVRLSLGNGPAEQANTHLALAQERAQEMVLLAAKGKTPEDALAVEMESHLRSAFQLAALADDEQMLALLTRARTMTQASGRELAAAQEGAHQQEREQLHHAIGLIALWGHEAESGLQDPLMFRRRYGPGGPCSGEECELPFGDAEGDGEQHQYGPGSPCQGDGCEPPFGDGEGDGEQHQYGPGNPCQGEGCEPPFGDGEGDGEQHQYGPGDPCQGEGCEPPFGDGEGDGEQHQYGPGSPCQGDGCEPTYGGSAQEQQPNQEQKQEQGQEDTSNENQEENGNGDRGGNGGQSGGSGGSTDSGGSGDTGGSAGSGGGGD